MIYFFCYNQIAQQKGKKGKKPKKPVKKTKKKKKEAEEPKPPAEEEKPAEETTEKVMCANHRYRKEIPELLYFPM